MEIFNICFSSDDNYAQHLGVTIASILKTNPYNEFHFYILDGGISSENKDKLTSLKSIKNFEITFISMDNKEFQDCRVNSETHILIPTFYRFKIPALFSSLEKILYLDSDLVVLKDLAPLFKIEMGEKWLAMVPDYFSDKLTKERQITDRPYYNAGVTLFNIKKCIQVELEKKLFHGAATIPNLPYMDQDVINEIVGPHILTLDPKYNVQFQPFVEGLENQILQSISDVVILHYTSGLKPWKTAQNIPLNNYYFKYLALTPWKGMIKKMIFQKIKRFCFCYIKTDKAKKWKLLGLTVFKKTRKQDYSRKMYFLGIPVWKKSPDTWHVKYDQLIQEQHLYKDDIEKIKNELSLLEGMKLLKREKK